MSKPERITTIFILLLLTVCATIPFVSAQSHSECVIGREIYTDGKLVSSCHIDVVDGTPIVTEIRDGTPVARTVTPSELAELDRQAAEKACLDAIEQAKTVLSTPASRGDLAEISTRLTAVETILLSDC